MTVPVTISASPLPDLYRKRFDLAPSFTVAEIVAHAFPDLPDAALDHIRVVLNHAGEDVVVPRDWWGRVRPHSGVNVIIAVVPGADGGLSLAIALLGSQVSGIAGAYVANTLAFAGIPAFVTNAVGFTIAAGVTVLSTRLAQSLAPVPESGRQIDQPEEAYEIAGWQNQVRVGDPIPWPGGRIRMAPFWIVPPYTDVRGEDQYQRGVLLFGFGRLDIADLKIGETPIDDVPGVEYEVREGQAGDGPFSLVPVQTIEKRIAIDLRKEGGDLEWHVFKTLPGTDEIAAIFRMPTGMIRYTDSANRRSRSTTIRIEQRAEGAATWTHVIDYEIQGKTQNAFWRQLPWQAPERGTWEVRFARVDDETDDPQKRDLVNLHALQSITYRAPVNTDLPLAMMSIRAKAGALTNGVLDEVNAVVTRYAPVWDGTTWTNAPSRNPASSYIAAVQSPANYYAVGNAGVDWEEVADFHEHCEAKGLHYDRVHYSGRFQDALTEIASAGRASPRDGGGIYGVVMDRSDKLTRRTLGPRNSYGFTWQRDYFRPPQAIRAPFRDETAGWAPTSRILPWIGHEGPIDRIEQVRRPGKTDPAEIDREFYRDMLIAEGRVDRFTVMVDGLFRGVDWGDRISLAHNRLRRAQASSLVTSAAEGFVVLEAPVRMEAGKSYGLRWITYDEDDPIGITHDRPVATEPGSQQILRLDDGETAPQEGDHVLFGEMGLHYEDCLVQSIEKAEFPTHRLVCTNFLPDLDALTEAYTPEDWTTGHGDEVAVSGTPAAPVIGEITTELPSLDYDGSASSVVIVPVEMPASDPVTVERITLQHRVEGAATWTDVAIIGNGGAPELTYATGTVIELQAYATSIAGNDGPLSALETFTVGGDAADVPAPVPSDAISVEGGLGHATISVTLTDPATTEIQLFRTDEGVALVPADDALGAPRSATLGATMVLVDGDTTRADLAAGRTWTGDGGWTVNNDEATHAPGVASTLSTSLPLTDGTLYRGRIEITGRTAGSITLHLAGGTPVADAPITADGEHLFALTAAAGNDRIEILASADCDASISGVTLYPATAACAPQGAQDYYIASINEDGVASAPTGPVTGTVI